MSRRESASPFALAAVAALLFLGGCGDGGGAGDQSVGTAASASASSVVDSVTLSPDSSATTLTIDPASIAARPTPPVAGVATHLPFDAQIGYDPTATASAVSSVGANSVRDEIFWSTFDPTGSGVSAIVPTRITSFLAQSSISPLLILNQGNSAVPGGNPPVTDSARAAFADFAGRAVRTMGSRVGMYEIWNEWNINAATSTTNRLASADDPMDTRAAINYARLAIAAGKAVKTANSAAVVIVGAAGDDPGWAWSRSIVDKGALQYADGFSVHLYNFCQTPSARTATNLVDQLSALRQTVTASSSWRDMPIYVSEWGWPNSNQECGGVPDSVAGPNIAQFVLYLAGTSWVGGGWLYELKDEAANSAQTQGTFGLLNYDFSDKSRTCFFREATTILKAATAIETQRISSDLFVAKVRTATGLRVLAWTTTGAGLTGRMTVGGTIPFTARTLCGASPSASGRAVTFGDSPLEISFTQVQPVAIQVKTL